VLALGIACVALYLARLALEQAGSARLVAYVPIAGAALELAVLFVAWLTVLEAWRVARPLVREPRLWLGLGLAALPPIVEATRYLASWKP
jgi:hypothetical protein